MKKIITAVVCIYMSMALWGCAGPAKEDLPLGSEEDIKAFFESLGLDVEVKEVTA